MPLLRLVLYICGVYARASARYRLPMLQVWKVFERCREPAVQNAGGIVVASALSHEIATPSKIRSGVARHSACRCSR